MHMNGMTDTNGMHEEDLAASLDVIANQQSTPLGKFFLHGQV